MNYWPRWIGSIQKKTSHLSLAEMGAYDRLLDHCYATEAPLPVDLDRCCRIAGAASKSERAAVASVLAEFFTVTDAGYVNERASAELLIAKPKIDAARTNGAKGGRPRKIPAETQRVSSGNPSGTQSESSTSSSTENTESAIALSARAKVGQALKAAGLDLTRVNLSDPRVDALLSAGATPEQFAGLASEALKGKKANPMAWVLSVMPDRLAQASQVKATKHAGFASKDYRNGVEADGTFTA